MSRPATRVLAVAAGTAGVVGDRALAAVIPGARLVEIPGAGHMPPYEAPDRLAEIILAAGPNDEEGGAS